MTRSKLTLALFLALAFSASAARGEDFAPQGDLERVVILSRHGVRSPTLAPEALKQWRRPDTPAWPDFGVQHPADLTLKGARLMQGIGAYYRKRWAGLFKPDACPANVSIWADRDERTLFTAQAIASGIAGGACLATIGEADTLIDPLFDPTSVLTDCKSDPPKAAPDSKDDVSAVQGVVDCCSKTLCQDLLHRDSCDIQDLEDSGSAEALKQAHAFVQSFGEILLFEYALGFNGDKFAFGKIRPQEMSAWVKLLAIHTRLFDATQRDLNVARPQGDNLLYHLARAIEARDPGLGETSVIAFVGHDTNIANVAALLGLEWQLPDYPQNDIPPGSALVFEVRKSGQTENVYAFMVGQTPEALRSGAPAFAQRLARIKGCTAGDGSCSLAEFDRVVQAALQSDKYGQCIKDGQPR